MKYKMYYLDGAGVEYDGGEWEIREIPKGHIFQLLSEPFFDLHCPPKMIIKKQNENKHCLCDWGDGTFTLYPFQSGVPHIFEPVLKNNL